MDRSPKAAEVAVLRDDNTVKPRIRLTRLFQLELSVAVARVVVIEIATRRLSRAGETVLAARVQSAAKVSAMSRIGVEEGQSVRVVDSSVEWKVKEIRGL
jgi:hypothetical protein